jgi:hypothetical protein
MKAINKSLEPVLKVAIADSLKNYKLMSDGNFLSDLYIYYDGEGQTLAFFDDVEQELLSVNLGDKNVDIVSDSQKEVKITAKSVLRELEKENVFEEKFICKPFSVSLVDSDFIVIEELIFIDDDTLKLDGDFWGNVDKELNAFLKNLMQ